MIRGKILKLIARYLASECTDDEKQQVEKWKDVSDNHKDAFGRLESIWVNSGKRREKWDPGRALSRLRLRLRDSDFAGDNFHGSGMKIYRLPARRKRQTRVLQNPVVQAASALVILAGLFYSVGLIRTSVLHEAGNGQTPLRIEEVSTKPGERATIRLDDGTKVMLNSSSRVSYTISRANERSFFLSGEAYFEAAHPGDGPLVIRTSDAVVRDIGTKFDVKAWPGDSATQVAVAEGKVLVSDGNDSSGSDLAVTHGQCVTVKKGGPVSTNAHADIASILAWIDGKLVFVDEPMKDVLGDLRRRYGFNCYVSDPSILTRTISATFDRDQPPGEVLDVIALTLGLRYRSSSDSVLFQTKRVAVRTENLLPKGG